MKRLKPNRRRGALELLAALGGGWLLARSPLLAVDDPLRGTLLVLPWVVLALVWSQRAAERRGGASLPAEITHTHGVLALALLALGLGRGALGLPLAAPVLAAGGTLLLAHRVHRQALALRPLLGNRSPRRPSALFFWLPLIVYLAIAPWTAGQRAPDGDEPYYLLLTHSLAYDLDVDLADEYADESWRAFIERPIAPQPGDPEGPDGEIYSRHNELLPIVLAPAYRLAGKPGALATMAALTALLAWLGLRLAARLFPEQPGAALAAWGVLAFAPPLLLYSTQVWAEVPAALLAAVAFDRVLTLRERRLSTSELLVGLALPLALLPWLKIRFILVAAPLLLLAWSARRELRRRLLPLAALLALFAAAVLWLNQRRFDNPLKIHSLDELTIYRRGLNDYLEGGLGLFFDPAFGLFGAAPIWLLLLPAALLVVRQRRELARDLALLTLPYLLAIAPRTEWYGGWAPPFRYGLVMLPLLALMLVPLLARRHRAGALALLAALGLATLALTTVWVAVPGWTYDFAHGSTHLADHLARATGSDVVRLLPSMVRPRPATWLWPVLAALAVCLGWWWPRRGLRPDSARALGAVVLLAAMAALPLLAARLPTRTIEAEDAHVLHRGGHLSPQRWMVERARYRGGWMLRPRESLRTPIVAGGARVELGLVARPIRNRPGELVLVAREDDRVLAIWRPELDRRWTRVRLGTFDWPADGRLTLEVRGERASEGEPNGVVVDRIELHWLDGEGQR